MFPETNIPEIPNTEEETNKMGISFLFDFETGDFPLKNGRVQKVEKTDAIKVWIEKILRTEKFKYSIYDTDEATPYGISLLDMINSRYPKEFIQEEIKREISEALRKNPEITGVTDFSFLREKRGLSCSFTVNTVYNTSIDMEVII